MDRRIAAGLVCLALLAVEPALGQDAVAFLSSVTGEVVLTRAGGESERARMGSQVAVGDSIKVARGGCTLIYLSGRTRELTPGPAHVVSGEATASSPLLARVTATLAEMSAAGGDSQGPAVHGMARDLGISGTRPMNTLLAGADFELTWRPLEGAAAYVVSVKERESGREQTVRASSPGVAASGLGILPGKRYTWSVRVDDALLSPNSGERWLEVAVDSVAAALTAEVERAVAGYREADGKLLEAAICYDRGFYHQAEQRLEEIASLPGMAFQTRPLLRAVRVAMGAPEGE